VGKGDSTPEAPPALPGGHIAILELHDVSKSFLGVRALDLVSMRVRRGEVHALVGENGAGKSTIVNLIGGVFQPDGGSIWFDNAALHLRDPADSLRQGIAIIHQESTVVRGLSVAENIFLGRLPKRGGGLVDWSELDRKARKVLAQVGLDIDPQTPVENLAIGGQQGVEIARAIALQPKLLIMDEPTSALTENEIKRLFEVIRRLKAEGLTVIFISHHLEEIWQIADRLTVLRDGQVVFTKSAPEVSPSELAVAMIGHALTLDAAGAGGTCETSTSSFEKERWSVLPECSAREEPSFFAHSTVPIRLPRAPFCFRASAFSSTLRRRRSCSASSWFRRTANWTRFAQR
jgi:ABC-type sugar transport system ATPase subunit